MKNRSATVYFSIRESKVNKKGLSPIEVSISYNGERIYFSTGKFAKPSEWNKVKQIVKGTNSNAILLNNYLVEFRNKIYEREIELMRRGITVTVHILKDAMLNKVDCLKDKSLVQMVDDYNEERKRLINKGLVLRTYKKGVHFGHVLKSFIKEKYKRDDLFLCEVNIGFAQSFHDYLIVNNGVCHNTSVLYISHLKAVMNKAVSYNYIQYNAISSYKSQRTPVEIDFLTEEELKKIINFNSPIKKFERTRDFFLFGCFTGLSYIDIKTLKPEHFEKDDEGRIWIRKKRVKTGVLSRIPLLPMARMILEKYKGGTILIPIYDCSYVNKIIKDIARECHINKHVTFHTSRHTFASTVTLSNNISLEVVSKMLGHTNTKMTTHYAKLLDKSIGRQMDTLADLYVNELNPEQDN